MNVQFYLSYDIKITLKLHFWCETDFVIIFVRLLWTPYDELYIKQ